MIMILIIAIKLFKMSVNNNFFSKYVSTHPASLYILPFTLLFMDYVLIFEDFLQVDLET